MSRGGEEELTSYRFGNGKKKKFPGSGVVFFPSCRVLAACCSAEKKRQFSRR